MTPAAFSAALTALGWSQRHLASALKCDGNLPSRWAAGTATIPPAIADWLTAWADFAAQHPPPQTWRRRA